MVPYTSGSVPVAVHTAHPPLADGSLVGHGGAALKLFVGLSAQQNDQLERMGQLEAPRGRRGEYYWPLKATAEGSLESGAQQLEGQSARDIVLRPISVTFIGMRDMLQNGTLYACDGQQWRLYAPLRDWAPRDAAGNVYYVVHGAYTL